jgi:prepilin-type N-terminal cleavage/methylation domain-containing protein
MQRQRRTQSGFTLIEIAIVLVIIGLLLGGVLQGQKMIENGRIKAAANDFNGMSAAVNAYRDKYKFLPGDDNFGGAPNTATGRGWTVTTNAGGNADGLLTGATPGTTFNAPGGERLGFYQMLRASGLITGASTTVGLAALPNNPWGGLESVAQMTPALGGLNGLALCMSQVPGAAALALDNQLDDGVANTGSLVSTVGVSGQNTQPGVPSNLQYNENNVYTVCRLL